MKKRIDEFLYRYIVTVLIVFGLRYPIALLKPVTLTDIATTCITVLIVNCLQEVFRKHDDKNN